MNTIAQHCHQKTVTRKTKNDGVSTTILRIKNAGHEYLINI